MKFLTLTAINLVVLGAIWFRLGTSEDSQEQSVELPGQALSEASSDQFVQLPSAREELEAVSVDTTYAMDGTTRKDLLQEYWQLLLGDDRDQYDPSLRADMFREMEFVMGLDVDEAKEYLDALIPLDLYWEKQELFSGLLINRIASKDPREAIIFMLQSDYEFSYEDYGSVVRFWMDKEGSSIMDWFENSPVGDIDPDLEEAFYTAYVEEDPYDFLVRFGSSDDHSDNGTAAALLYEEQGAEVFKDLQIAGLDRNTLGDCFRGIGYQIYKEDSELAREWVMANRYSVDESDVNGLAVGMLGHGAIPNAETALENFEWAYTNRLVSIENPEVQQSLRRLGNQLPEATRAVLGRLESYVGEEAVVMKRLLPAPKQQEQATAPDTLAVKESQVYEISSCLYVIEDDSANDAETVERLVASLRKNPAAEGSL